MNSLFQTVHSLVRPAFFQRELSIQHVDPTGINPTQFCLDDRGPRGVEVAGQTRTADGTTTSANDEQPLLLSQTITASGGSRATVSWFDWLNLVRIWKLTARHFSRS